MKDFDQKKAAKEFAERWKDKGYEKGESQKYWIDLLQNVLGVDNPIEFIEFEDTVHIDKATGFIDGYIPSTKILIEQKSIDKDLRKPIKQSDGSLLNPFQQAKRYAPEMGHDRYPRYVITCNFKSFLVYDMNNPNGEPEEILLKDLGKEYYRLSFIVDSKNEHLKKEEELSFKAGELVGKLYDAFSKQYKDLTNEQSQKDLNELCVRLVFCLYAEDAGLFGRKNVFHDYLAKYDDLTLMRENLIKLFKILDTPNDKRDPYLEDELNQFPYVNGGLFSNENIEIPTFTEEIKNTLLAKASDEFDWSEISPTIFGAVFESTLNPETRRAGGMHYTSIENIHKVIDPLFLDDLRENLNEIEAYKNEKTRNEKLIEFQNYLGSLTFFDPACGSGNFLTETYLSLRRLENEALEVQQGKGVISLDVGYQIKVSIQQFYGIEINDFAVKVAKTALWIAESQMVKKTEEIVNTNIQFLPLKSYNNIVEGNALRIDWNEVLPNIKCNYIMGNPPFVGASQQSEEQRKDLEYVWNEKQIDSFNYSKKIDYVSGWYIKAANYMKNTKIKTSFVSTNSITQGEQVIQIWKPLLEQFKIKINFAYQTFRWDSEASIKAHVHCVIIGFSYVDDKNKKIYTNNKYKIASNINGYLLDAKNTYIENRKTSISNAPKIEVGNRPADGGHLIIEENELQAFLQKEPNAKQFIKLLIGPEEFINNKKRYCLWLVDITPNQLKSMPEVMKRVELCRNDRLASEPTKRRLAATPTLFRETKNPDSYILIPAVSSEKRRYIPMGFLDKNVIPRAAALIICDASLYDFGILESNVHMSWMRAVCGRLEMRYNYSANVVYNNFPWPNPTKEQREKIEKTAQLILNARAKYPDSSLADLYDEIAMPSDLRRAHQLNDIAVMEAYGFSVKTTTESDCVAKLMQMYQELTKNE